MVGFLGAVLIGAASLHENRAFAGADADASGESPQRRQPSVETRLEIGVHGLAYRDETGPDHAFHDDDTIRFDESEFELSVDWSGKVKATFLADLSYPFVYEHPNRIDFNDDFLIERFIENAWLELRDPDRLPFTLALGKRDILLGLHDLDDVLAVPLAGPSSAFWRRFQSSDTDGVMGLTVAFAMDAPHPVLPDTVAVSLYEDEGGDFDIEGEKTTWQVRMEKRVANADLVAAYGVRENGHLDPGHGLGDGSTAVLGLKAAVAPDLTGWVEAILFDDHRYESWVTPPPDSWGVAVGGALDLFDGGLTLIGSVEHIDQFTRHHVLGARVPLRTLDPLDMDTELGLQVSHGVYDDTHSGSTKWEPDTSYVARLKLTF